MAFHNRPFGELVTVANARVAAEADVAAKDDWTLGGHWVAACEAGCLLFLTRCPAAKC
jgi:hypothetical protein